jgi:endonuclease III related protein
MTTRETLNRMFELLSSAWGPQHWWPGETPFEVMVGAVLTQNTNWRNVEKAIRNLKARDLLSPAALAQLPAHELAELIRPAGYYNIKAKRLGNLVRFLMNEFSGDLDAMRRRGVGDLRERLLSVSGVGRETCDSILLYALGKPTFVVDAYTARVLLRHGLVDESADYDEIKETFESNLPVDVQMFNEYHALLVRAGKLHCQKHPKCQECPLDALFEDPSRRPMVE